MGKPCMVLCVVLCLGIFWSELGALRAKGDVVSSFLDDKEDQVVRIANLATINELSTCESVATCMSDCTRLSCAPLLSDNLTCTPVAVNTNCYQDQATQNGTCTDIRANFARSYVRTTEYGALSSDATAEIPFEIQNSVCSQRLLDPLFLDLQKLQNSSSYYFNFYFGSVDGSFRFYPGVEVKDCYGFDPRIRPWYTGAISVQKDLVVLLDTDYSMGDNVASATFQSTRLAAAQNATQDLLNTLTPNDRATVITFNDSAQATTLSQYPVPSEGLNTSDPAFQQLQQFVGSTSTSNSIGVSGANYTAGLKEAISTLNQNSPPGALKIVIMFTDGASSPSTEELDPAIRDLVNGHIRLFIFEIGDNSNPALGQLACQAEGYAEKLNPLNLIQDPLFTLNSYFSFLAQSQMNTTDKTRPFWQSVYADFGNLGQVITVAYPAMSSDGSRLLGVAGIDVQTDGLGVNFRNLLDSDLVNSRRIDITTNTVGVDITTCSPAYNDTLGQCSSSNYSSSPFCGQDDFTSKYEELVCCAGCGSSSFYSSHSKRSSTSNNTVITIIVVCGVALLAAIAVSICLYRRFCRPRTGPSGVEEFVRIPMYSYEALFVGTNEFADENKLGDGTFGTVYKCILPDGSKVAVKQLKQPNYGIRDFEAEIMVLAKTNHTNLVALKGFCVEKQHHLVYEFVENGDLDQWLFVKPETEKKVLPWKGRVVIALGVAKGLAYLHEDLQNQQKVCHSDIKPANILLDAEFNPKVADFGMSKLYQRGAELPPYGGTIGYMAPEFHEGAPATTRTDVYSYGMVVLEMVTGRKFSDPDVRWNFRHWVALNLKDRTESVLDSRLGELEEEEEEMAERLLKIALRCTLENSDDRPDMSAVFKMIEGSQSVRSLPLYVDNEMTELSNTVSSETSSLGLNVSRSGPASDGSSSQGKTWTISEIFNNIVRLGRSSPRDQSSQGKTWTISEIFNNIVRLGRSSPRDQSYFRKTTELVY